MRLQNHVQNTAGFAGSNHVSVERLEDAGVFPHRIRQCHPGFHICAGLEEHLLKVFAVLLLTEYLQALDEWQSSVKHHRELSREESQSLVLDLFSAQLWQAYLTPLFPCSCQNNLLTPKHCFKRGTVSCHSLTDDNLVHSIAALKNISRHLCLPFCGFSFKVRGNPVHQPFPSRVSPYPIKCSLSPDPSERRLGLCPLRRMTGRARLRCL